MSQPGSTDITRDYDEGDFAELISEATGCTPCKVLEYEKSILIILPDDEPFSPIEDPEAHFGHMICFHSKYSLGDEHKEYYQKEADAFVDWLAVQVKKHQIVLLPLYLYDHSGISMSYSHTYPYDDRWDAGMVGYIYATFEDIRSNWNIKRVTRAWRQKAVDLLKGIVDEYDDYLRGDAYGFKLICKCCGGEINSCWGFLGSDLEKNGLLDYAGDPKQSCPLCQEKDAAFWVRYDASLVCD